MDDSLSKGLGLGWELIDAVPTCFGIKTRLGMSGRVYFDVFNKIFFLQNIGFEHATDRSHGQI